MRINDWEMPENRPYFYEWVFVMPDGKLILMWNKSDTRTALAYFIEAAERMISLRGAEFLGDL